MSNTLVPREILRTAFPGIPETEAAELILTGEVKTYPPDTILCHEDEFESTFYIILSGKVKVTKQISSDQVRVLKTLTTGDFFGEMALLHNTSRAASVTTLEPTTVLEIHKEAFSELLQRSHIVSLAIVQEVSRRLRENDAMAIEDLRLKAGELATAYQQLAEQEYLRREFLSDIAHELRTPLTAANGYLQILTSAMQAGQPLEEDMLRNSLEVVSRNIHQIITLVNDLLFLQEMDLIFIRFQPVYLPDILRSTVDKLADKARENQVKISLTIDSHLPLVQGDAKSLERAFSAVLENAIKFSPDGGDVLIHASSKDNCLAISFQDHGVGIAPEILPRIFDRFFHVDQIQGHLFRGMGLGLSIARQVIEQHHGNISVESELGKGTTVTIQLVPTEDLYAQGNQP